MMMYVVSPCPCLVHAIFNPYSTLDLRYFFHITLGVFGAHKPLDVWLYYYGTSDAVYSRFQTWAVSFLYFIVLSAS